MNILCEDTIPYGQEYFETLGHVTTYSWQRVSAEDLRDIDILVVRSTTQVNQALLCKANRLQFVTTATAGTNHMDKRLLEEKGIAYSSAAGCNAIAVAEYVISALIYAAKQRLIAWPDFSVGIVGAGNVGTALAKRLECLGIRYHLCDPPLENSGDQRAFVDMDTIAQCDVVSMHVPFITTGAHPTVKLINSDFLQKMSQSTLLINACRGEVVDEADWVSFRRQNSHLNLVADVFCNEPDINLNMIESSWMCTPHIAGHSLEGKLRGTQMVYEQVCERLGRAPERSLDSILPDTPTQNITLKNPKQDTLSLDDLSKLFFSAYDIQIDDRHFRQEMAKSNLFASMRKHYRIRRECSAYQLAFTTDISEGISRQIKALGFRIAH